MTIAELAGPVLLQVLPTACAVLLTVAGVVAAPVVVPRLLCWLRGPDHAGCRHGGAVERASARGEGDHEVLHRV